MVFLVHLSYPVSSAEAVAEMYQNRPALPEGMVERGPYIYPARGLSNEVANSIIIFEFEDAKMAEAAIYVGGRYNRLVTLPEVSYSSTLCAEQADIGKMAEVVQ
jgi:hypothetical protein